MKVRVNSVPLASRVVLLGVLVYLLLVGFNTLTRTGQFSPDSMNYVNVARNIAKGQGITQPSLGFNQRFSVEERIPSPVTAQPPLYPLMIALVSQLGIVPEKSALLISVISYGAVLLLSYRLATVLYNGNVALLTIGLLPFYYPLRLLASYALTETTGIALLLLSLLLLAKRLARQSKLLLFCAGLTAGLAFSTRYALLPLVFAGISALLLSGDRWQRRFNDACVYTFGFVIPAGLVWGHNFLVAGFLMPSFNRSTIGLKDNVIAAALALFGNYLGANHVGLQLLGFGFVLLFICAVLSIKRDWRYLREVGYDNNRKLLTLWTVFYLVFLIASRTHTHFDEITARLTAPVAPMMIVLGAALVSRVIKNSDRWTTAVTLLALTLAIAREASAAMSMPAINFGSIVPTGERLEWVEQNTSEQDLVIGDDTIDIPFYFKAAPTISFSRYPWTDYPTYEKIMAYSRGHCHEYRNIYLILRRDPMGEAAWRANYGDFFADLAFGKIEKYPNIVFLNQLSDALVFKIQCR